MSSICLNMIVKNESHVIESTLTNLYKFIQFDYYVICDTGSEDNTKEVITQFFTSKNVKGEIHDCTWKDFGYNRTEALEKAYDKTDFLFIFDADDKIHGEFSLPEMLKEDKYDFKFGTGFEYKRPLLVNNRKKWKFIGVLHEFLVCSEESKEAVFLDGNYYIESGKSGSRSNDPKKYEKDAAILVNACEIEKDEGLKCRYAFYAAQSFKDSNQTDKAIEWYEKVVNKLSNWPQEKFFSCIMIGNLCLQKNQNEKSMQYYLKSIEFDSDRIEGIVQVANYYQKTNHHLLAHLLCEKYKDKLPNYSDKLFINTNDYQDQLDFINSISGFYCNEKDSSFQSIVKILQNKRVNESQLQLSYHNLVFYKDQIRKIEFNKEFLFSEYNQFIQRNPKNEYYPIWDEIFSQYKNNLLNYNDFNEQKRKNKENPRIFLSMTTCKRFHLFYQTMNSILNTWMDVDEIDYWYIVDDNSTEYEKKAMKFFYPWIDYNWKNPNQKGHAISMQMIYNKIEQLKPTYWIHLEDDFLFFDKMNVIETGLKGLDQLKKYNCKQICFNRSYGETINHYDTESHQIINNEYALHVFDKDRKANGPNCYYWPHFSFRPSIIDVEALQKCGNFGSQGFIEMDFAHRWTQRGFTTGFFNKLIHIHIGRLTNERHDDTKLNAYNLNQTSQFGEQINQKYDVREMLASEFIFVKGLDQIGNDGGFKQSIGECVQECVQHNLEGFNSLGFLKKKIEKFSPSPYFKDKDGLYVRKDVYTRILLEETGQKNIRMKIEKKEKTPFIKIINLEMREDRKKDTQKKLLDVGFYEHEFEFIKATNGYELKPSREMNELFKGNDFAYRKGIIGCAYSHYYLWKQLIEDDEHEFYVIMEDDIILKKEFKEKLNELKKELSEKDTVFLGYHIN